MNKNIRVLIYWIFAIYTIYVGYKVLFPSKNQKPIELIEKTVSDISKGTNSTYQVKNIYNIDRSLLDKYEFYIAIDLSKSVNAKLRQEKKDEILIDLISKIKSNFINKGLNVKTYFFGTGIIEVKHDDVMNFSLDKLNEYKTVKFSVKGNNYQLEKSTDIISALQTIIGDNVSNDKKEKFIIFITDDIYTSFNNSVNIQKSCSMIYNVANEMNNTSFILYKYPGIGGKHTTPNLIQNYFEGIFERKSVRLENIAKELVSNLQLSMYIHDLTTIRGSMPNDDIPYIKDANYKKNNSTIYNSRFRAEFLGKGNDDGTREIELYPKEGITYFNFKFINDYNYFPIKIKLKGVDFLNDSLSTIDLKKEIKIDNSKYLTVNNFILEPNESKIWTIPVNIKYNNSFFKNILLQKESLDFLKIDYELEFLGKNEELYSSLYKNINKKPSHKFYIENKVLHYRGNQISQLQSTLITGEKENLLIKTFPPSFLTLIIWLLTTIIYLFLAILIRKPTINNWTIAKNEKKIKVKGQKILRMLGDYEDPQGDVIIKAYKYRISFNPFKRQPKDILLINFKYGADKINNKGEIIGVYKGIVRLNSKNRIHAQIYDDIELKIY